LARSDRIHWSSLIRQAHLYLGMLIAPSLLMFAASGAFQIYRLNDAKPGYTPPAVIKTLGELHKNQRLAAPPRPPRPDAKPGARARAPEAPPKTPLSRALLQGFALVVAVGLFVSTALGVWMGAVQSRWKVTARWLLLAGIVVPIAVLFIPG
jgi:hypothetical protein